MLDLYSKGYLEGQLKLMQALISAAETDINYLIDEKKRFMEDGIGRRSLAQITEGKIVAIVKMRNSFVDGEKTLIKQLKRSGIYSAKL